MTQVPQIFSAWRLRAAVALGAATVVVGLSGCDLFNPCISLAQRICECEASPSARETCRQVRIEALRNNIDITEDQLTLCQEKLETCDCTDLAENRVEECGYVVE